MSTIFNIISMHRSQELTETLRAYEDQRANERAEKRANQCMDITQEIRDTMTQDEYIAWWEATPENGFFNAACDQLLSMKLGTERDGTEPSPIISGGEILYLQTSANSDDSIPF